MSYFEDATYAELEDLLSLTNDPRFRSCWWLLGWTEGVFQEILHKNFIREATPDIVLEYFHEHAREIP